MIDFKQENNEYNIFAWKSKGVYTLKLFPSHNLSLTTNNSDHKKEFQFNDSVLVVEKNNYNTEMVNAYMVNVMMCIVAIG